MPPGPSVRLTGSTRDSAESSATPCRYVGNSIWWIGPDALEACQALEGALAIMCHSDDIVIGRKERSL